MLRLLLLTLATHTSALQLLSDLSTPCAIVNIGAWQKQLGTLSSLPPVRLGSAVYHATQVEETSPHQFDNGLSPKVLDHGLILVHASVIEAPLEAGLARLDVDPTLDAHLVLGLNHHHVVGYYWARAAGAGAVMEAPGIRLEQACLVWDGDDYRSANSNDGKRSEWVAFLRPCDQVQLWPHAMIKDAVLWGVSDHGRPLGSEPAVVCRLERQTLASNNSLT